MSEINTAQIVKNFSTPSTIVDGQPTEVGGVELMVAQRVPGRSDDHQPEIRERRSKSDLPVTNNSDVFLRFQVDGESHEITVFVVDRTSKRVVRAIPPEELNKLKAGDLLELFA